MKTTYGKRYVKKKQIFRIIIQHKRGEEWNVTKNENQKARLEATDVGTEQILSLSLWRSLTQNA